MYRMKRMDDRMEKAARWGLSPQEVGRLFQAILEFSRRVQGESDEAR